MVRSVSLVRPCLGLIVPTFLPFIFYIRFYYYSCVYFLNSYFILAVLMREVLSCEMHTPCMGSPFPIVHTRRSLVFLSFSTTLSRWVRTTLNLLNNNNKNMCFVDTSSRISLFFFVTINVIQYLKIF